jgi:hypothetical protein
LSCAKTTTSCAHAQRWLDKFTLKNRGEPSKLTISPIDAVGTVAVVIRYTCEYFDDFQIDSLDMLWLYCGNQTDDKTASCLPLLWYQRKNEQVIHKLCWSVAIN